MTRSVVTGGCGFIGSHLVDTLLRDQHEVVVLDNLSTGQRQNLQGFGENPNLQVLEGDCKQPIEVHKALDGVTRVYHLAANSEIRRCDPELDFKENIVATRTMLEALRRRDVENLTFTSTSTVYGDAAIRPTPEDYGPLKPISSYGASKLACEALVSSYSHLYGIRSTTYRLANIVGSRQTRGVIPDFIKKLRHDPTRLEILGDGKQTKSYLHIDDCIRGILHGDRNAKDLTEIYNLGSPDQISVTEIAGIVSGVMSLKDVDCQYTGGVDGGRGWQGDVINMLLDISKLESTGWTPRGDSRQATDAATREILREL